MKKLYYLGLCIFLTSCATIVNGSKQTVGITSTPSDATVYVDQKYIGKTPLKACLTRKDNHTVCIECPGYEPYQFALKPEMSKWVFGNIAFGGIVGIAIDAISGGLYKLTAEQAHEVMKSENLAKLEDNIAIVLKADPSWKQIGQMTPSAELEDHVPSIE